VSVQNATTHEQSFVLGRRGDIVEFTSLDDFSVNLQFLLRTLQDQLFDSVRRDKSQNSDFLLLTNTMRTILRLQIGVRIPVSVVAIVSMKPRNILCRLT